MRILTFMTLLGALSLPACGGDDAQAEAEAEAAVNDLAAALGGARTEAVAEAEAEAEAAPAGDLDLPKVGLKVSAPAGTTVSDTIVGEGHMVMGPGLVLTVNAATDTSPETLDAAKEEADLYSPTNINEETLDDGWVLTYENTGGMGTNYFVTVRRTIGETTVMCATTASSTEQQAAAVSACKSLHS